MSLIYETDNFHVLAHPRPQICRTEGGHIKIVAKRPIEDRTGLTPTEAIELMRLTMIVGEAMVKGMEKRGINIVKINYQENGNWAFKYGKRPHLHIHLYARTVESKGHPFPEAVVSLPLESGYYDNFKPLDNDDIKEIRAQILKMVKEDKYQLEKWHL